ncbi:TIGR00266 family protein [Methanocaldococcus sp. 10A]
MKGKDYEFEIKYSPSYSLLEVKLNNQEINAETGAMVYMDSSINVDTNVKGGIFGALKRAIVGESIFINKFSGCGKIGLAPSFPGDIIHHTLEGVLYAQSGSYLASSPNIEIDTKFGGAKTFFGGKGIFLIKLEGEGDMFLSSFGAIAEIELNDENIIVDNGNLVAFTEGLDYRLTKLGSLKSAIFGGEGKVYEFSGTGKIYIQSRNLESFISMITPYIQTKK